MTRTSISLLLAVVYGGLLAAWWTAMTTTLLTPLGASLLSVLSGVIQAQAWLRRRLVSEVFGIAYRAGRRDARVLIARQSATRNNALPAVIDGKGVDTAT